jgi:rhamnosyltransferase
MPPTEQRSAVVAIIAAYSPAESLVETVIRLFQQLDHVVVVDDGSPPSSAPIFARLQEAGAAVVHQPGNTGIASALNAGLQAADAWRPSYYLTLDQDSRIAGDYVDQALKTYGNAIASGLDVGFICASAYSGHAVPIQASEGGFMHAFDPMQSGFLIPRSTVERLGDFDEGLFIDGVDSEYTMRARAGGLAVLVGEGCTIEHDLGQRQPGLLFGRQVRLRGMDVSYNYHSPSRVYYICRNGTVLTKRYALKSPGWVLRRLSEELKAHVLRFTFSPDRGLLLRAAIRGIRDGFAGTTGRIPADLERRLK